MKFHLHTDIGHDPDDVVALCYLIENGYIPTSVSISPGYVQQMGIVQGIFKDYGLSPPTFYRSKSNPDSSKYVYGPHSKLTKLLTIAGTFCRKLEDCVIECDSALIIGPAINLGGRLVADRMVFQGGYSPNSINPLEKFKGQMSVQSFNPSGAKKDFASLRDSKDIRRKYYVGKNVCHGFTKADLGDWSPGPIILEQFYDDLPTAKAMHDLLAAKMLIDPQMGIWEKAKPVFRDGLKMSTEHTDENIYTLIGLGDLQYINSFRYGVTNTTGDCIDN